MLLYNLLVECMQINAIEYKYHFMKDTYNTNIIKTSYNLEVIGGVDIILLKTL